MYTPANYAPSPTSSRSEFAPPPSSFSQGRSSSHSRQKPQRPQHHRRHSSDFNVNGIPQAEVPRLSTYATSCQNTPIASSPTTSDSSHRHSVRDMKRSRSPPQQHAQPFSGLHRHLDQTDQRSSIVAPRTSTTLRNSNRPTASPSSNSPLDRRSSYRLQNDHRTVHAIGPPNRHSTQSDMYSTSTSIATLDGSSSRTIHQVVSQISPLYTHHLRKTTAEHIGKRVHRRGGIQVRRDWTKATVEYGSSNNSPIMPTTIGCEVLGAVVDGF